MHRRIFNKIMHYLILFFSIMLAAKGQSTRENSSVTESSTTIFDQMSLINATINEFPTTEIIHKEKSSTQSQLVPSEDNTQSPIMNLPSLYTIITHQDQLQRISSVLLEKVIDHLEVAGKKACPTLKSEEIRRKTHEALECLQLKEGEIFCDLQNKLDSCMAPLVVLFQNCMEIRRFDLPPFYVKVAKGFMDYVCNKKGSYFIELFNPCVLKNHKTFASCDRELELKSQLFDFFITNFKTSYCWEMVTFKYCYLTPVIRDCPRQVTKDAYVEYVRSMISVPCGF